MICQTKFFDAQMHTSKAFRKSSESQFEDVVKSLGQHQDEEEGKKENLILCKNCRNKITTVNYMTEVNGRYKHTFSNPYGIVFEIVCFALAKGCLNQGMPTMEFTWFKGFSWRYALCSKCHVHLGWYYQSKGGASFYGLISDNLIEGI